MRQRLAMASPALTGRNFSCISISRTERSQLFDQTIVTAVEMMGVVDRGAAVGGQAGQH